MPRLLALLIASGAVLTANAQPTDRLDSAECAAARGELEATLDDPGAGRAERAQRLAAVRKKTSDICLGPASAQPRRAGAPERPVAVPAPIISAPPLYPTARGAPLPPPAVSTPGPAFITSCDTAGCWDNAGHRLNNLGPMLVGPRGLCTLQGGAASCP